ncbi:MAG: hypothetical protein LC796_14160 [Acidobacteria bacterium]|nr:hypothetical protein [Acidobacteriota bacterium]
MTAAAARCLFVPAAALLLGCGGLCAAPMTPTPTPRPKLSGGFGRTPVPGASEGQSLADVVRAASSSHKPRDQKPVAITNDSLVKDPSKGRVTTAKVRPVTPAGPAGAATPASAALPAPVPIESTSVPAAAAPGAEEAKWRDASHAARRRVEELTAQLASLEGEAKQLENDFYRWDDGQYRDRVIKPAWDKKREELETTRKELTSAQADLADLPEKARRAGALPGWLRE